MDVQIAFLDYYSQCRVGKLKSTKIFDFIGSASNDVVKDTLTLDQSSLSPTTFFDGLGARMTPHLKKGWTSKTVKQFFDGLEEEDKDEFFEIIQKLQIWRYEHNLVL
jgi:hypothetical protein